MTAQEKTIAVIVTVVVILIIVWLIAMTYTLPPGAIPTANGSMPATTTY